MCSENPPLHFLRLSRRRGAGGHPRARFELLTTAPPERNQSLLNPQIEISVELHHDDGTMVNNLVGSVVTDKVTITAQ